MYIYIYICIYIYIRRPLAGHQAAELAVPSCVTVCMLPLEYPVTQLTVAKLLSNRLLSAKLLRNQVTVRAQNQSSYHLRTVVPQHGVPQDTPANHQKHECFH